MGKDEIDIPSEKHHHENLCIKMYNKRVQANCSKVIF